MLACTQKYPASVHSIHDIILSIEVDPLGMDKHIHHTILLHIFMQGRIHFSVECFSCSFVTDSANSL